MEQEEMLKMLVALAKRLDELEDRVKGGMRSRPDATILKELRAAAAKIKLGG